MSLFKVESTLITKNRDPCPLKKSKYEKNQQQQINHLTNGHSHSRGVANLSFRIPMLHGNRFSYWFPCNAGTSKTSFATPPQREGELFHLFNTSTARSSKMIRMLFSNHCVGASRQWREKRIVTKIGSCPRHFVFLTKIVLSKHLINVYNNHSFSKWILTNPTKQCIRIYSNSSKKSCDFASPPLVLTHFRFWRFSMIVICCHNWKHLMLW